MERGAGAPLSRKSFVCVCVCGCGSLILCCVGLFLLPRVCVGGACGGGGGGGAGSDDAPGRECGGDKKERAIWFCLGI